MSFGGVVDYGDLTQYSKTTPAQGLNHVEKWAVLWATRKVRHLSF